MDGNNLNGANPGPFDHSLDPAAMEIPGTAGGHLHSATQPSPGLSLLTINQLRVECGRNRQDGREKTGS